MAKHSQRPDMPIVAAFVGAHQAREELAEQGHLEQATQRTHDAVARMWERHRRDLETVEASSDVVPRLLDQGGLDRCQQPGCLDVACWYVRFRRGTTHRPAYRRLCTRDAARRIRRRAHISTRRDQTR